MTDVFIIGGGPAGLAAAIAARRKGFQVTVADGRKPPIDKACGEGLMPDGLAAANALGLRLPESDSFRFRGIRFVGEGASVAAEFANGCGAGVRRTRLHSALAELAQDCGVDLQWGRPVNTLEHIAARWIVGADGTGSRVRSSARLDRYHRDTRRYGFRLHFRITPWSDYVEIHWGEGYQIYITPVGPDEICVALISSDPALRPAAALQKFPDLASRLASAPENSTGRGALTASRRLRQVTRGNVALIGDASGSVDAITGEGICLGFRQALALADAMEQGDLALYESAHPRLARRPRFMADFMLTMDRRHWLRSRALAALASRPDLFRGFLAMHTGVAHSPAFAANCIELGWRMLTAVRH
jgi:flavin-dependent dehydrogenase